MRVELLYRWVCVARGKPGRLGWPVHLYLGHAIQAWSIRLSADFDGTGGLCVASDRRRILEFVEFRIDVR